MEWGNESLFKQSWSHDQDGWPACPYMVKTLKNLLLRNQKADDLETWYAPLCACVLPSCSTDDSKLTLTFYGKVKFGPLCFCMGKKVKQWLFQKLL